MDELNFTPTRPFNGTEAFFSLIAGRGDLISDGDLFEQFPVLLYYPPCTPGFGIPPDQVASSGKIHMSSSEIKLITTFYRTASFTKPALIKLKERRAKTRR